VERLCGLARQLEQGSQVKAKRWQRIADQRAIEVTYLKHDLAVIEPIGKIDHFITQYKQNCKPFVWTATADSILAKLQRLCSRISEPGH
jgi:hypothetical protein